jgi:SAM-dependent methyltransferase
VKALRVEIVEASNNSSRPERYSFLDFNAPLSSSRADAIARALAGDDPRNVLDLGCGWGELLLRVLAAGSKTTGLGIDSDAELIARARVNAAARGLSDRVEFVAVDAPTKHEPVDAVICVGADHAYGTQSDALMVLFDLVEPGGLLLFGSGFWEQTPTPGQAASIGLEPDSLTDLADLVDLAISIGFRPLAIQTANRDEWEQFESGFLADREQWLRRHGDDPAAEEIRAKADAHRTGWLRGYRNVLGFAYLTLTRAN